MEVREREEEREKGREGRVRGNEDKKTRTTGSVGGRGTSHQAVGSLGAWIV